MVNWNHHKEEAVYALHAGDHVYCYAGSTSLNIVTRMYQHRHRARKGHNAPVYRWMREVGIENVQCHVIAYEQDADIRHGLEVSTIAQLKSMGYPLRNRIWFPGDGLATGSKEYRRIMNQSPLAGLPREPKLRSQRIPRHGTVTEYRKYKCECETCIDGYEAYMTKRLGRPFVTRRRTTPAHKIHGTVACYKNGLCRCLPCAAAYREYKRSLPQRQRAA